MKKIMLVFVLFIALGGAYAQESDNAKLQVQGQGKIKVMPDEVVLNLHVMAKDLDYQEAIEKLDDKMNDLQKAVKRLDFEPEELKTINFRVEVNRVYNERSYQDSGYVASQNLKIRFANEKQKINEVISRLMKNNSMPQFNVSFQLSEETKNKLEKELIQLAVSDAKEKAETIAQVAALQLIKIDRINYHTQSDNYFPVRMESMEMPARKADSFESDINPEEITLTRTIDIIWKIL